MYYIEIELFVYIILFSSIFCMLLARSVVKDKYENSRSLILWAGVLAIVPIVSLIFIGILAMIKPKKPKDPS